MPSPQLRSNLFTSVFAIAVLWILVPGAKAQSNNKPVSAGSTVAAAQHAGSVSATPTPNWSPHDGQLKFVVALFRHGVRSPLKEFPDKAGEHSKDSWPKLTDWDARPDAKWGDLTPHGAEAVKVLGFSYGKYYSNAWGNGFKAYLWADSQDERTLATAVALAKGLQGAAVKVQVDSLKPGTTDPLFHPFTANCGTPSQDKLNRIVSVIEAKCPQWLDSLKDELDRLDDVLACANECGVKPCEPLSCISCFKETSSPTPAPSPTPRQSSPLKWEGRFSYASSATEAFLLEYANRMNPGWGRVKVGEPGCPQLAYLLRLHEFYFDKTERELELDNGERDQYLAGIQGANLVREIYDQLNKAANKPLMGKCPRPSTDSKFVALVGHDTNLANVQTLLGVTWSFGNDAQLPADLLGVPDNDALPAGALVYELHEPTPSNFRVRIQYIAQSLTEMRSAPQAGAPFHLQTTCGGVSPCEMPLQKFNNIVENAIKDYRQFLSGCKDGNQVCPQPTAAK